MGLLEAFKQQTSALLSEEGSVQKFREQYISHDLIYRFETDQGIPFPNSWRARETYDIFSNNEFVETFELATPGGSFETYSRNHFKRVTK